MKQWNINAVVDGEIVVVNEHGVPSFSDLQLWRSEDDGQLLYYLFDILWLEGYLVTHLPLEERKQLLKAILPKESFHLCISEILKDNGEEAFELATTVSAPLYWEEVKKGLKLSQFTLGNMPARLKSEVDIFKKVLGKGINIQKAIKKIESLYGDLLKRAA